MPIIQSIIFRTKFFFRKLKEKITIPSYAKKRSLILAAKNKYNTGILVETGTFLGDTVEYFRDKFSKVISIELAPELAANAKKRFENAANVTIIEGNSGQVLKEMVPSIKEPVLFWLDGHYSSEFFIGDVYIKTAKGEKDTPVEEELEAIFKSGVRHIIMIDDARLFVGSNDYPTISRLTASVQQLNPDYRLTVKNDIIYILPK